MPAKRTEPSRSLLNQASGFKYTNSASTNLAKKFADMRRAAAKAEREAAKQQASAAQTQLELATVTAFPMNRKTANAL
ncbi:hypothetical protein KXJ72_10425 [Comamonas aquatica]|nr:hypothetical protein KXJ72_10425 [Comamonas aquatica]